MSGSSALLIEALENQENLFSTNEDFSALLDESYADTPTEGSVVTGVVVAIENEFIIMDVGVKSEGRIPLKEFMEAGQTPEIAVGDEFDIYVEKFEDRNGEAQLSRERAVREAGWNTLEKKWKAEERVDGIIFGRVKGGFTVDVEGSVAFLPGSQVDVRPIRDITPLMNVTQPFMILKMDRKRSNIVVSRRAIMEESRSEQRDELLDNIKEGVTLEGMVKNITDYGVFVDMGGVDGLLHVTDISWKRINHPSEVYKVGDTIKVMVTKFDEKTKRISLGVKQLEENPWEGLEAQFTVGARFKGKISNITDYGAFVELENGVEGLVHVSEMSWTKKNQHPSKIVTQGEEVEVEVLDVDLNKHRISLGIKQCQENPWNQFAAKYPEGTEVEGEVRNITDFGLFVGLEGDIDGLVHHSDISWNEPGEEAIKAYNKGDTVKAKVLLLDVEKERISLGIKQLDGERTEASTAASKRGKVVTCEVTAVQNDGLEVKFGDDGQTSFIKKNDIARERQEQRPDRFAVGDRLDAKITSSDKKTGRVNLSIKALEMDEHKKAIQEYGSSDSGASLGDILGAALEGAKDDKKD